MLPGDGFQSRFAKFTKCARGCVVGRGMRTPSTSRILLGRWAFRQLACAFSSTLTRMRGSEVR